MRERSTPFFVDREEVGRRLAARLEHYRGSRAIVVALPRGGVVVGYEVASTLLLPFDLLVVRKIGHPENPELGVGALVEGAPVQLDTGMLRALGISVADLRHRIEEEQREIVRRVQLYRGGREFMDVKGRIVLLMDDGIATGNTAKAAIAALRFRGARRVVLAVGVAPPATVRELRRVADELVCLASPPDFMAVGQFYEHFDPVEDDQVLELMRRGQGLIPAS